MSAFTRRPLSAVRLLALAGLATIVLVGCGGDGTDKSRLLSRSSASDLRLRLNNVERLVDGGKCDQAKIEATAFEHQVSTLRRLDRRLREALTAGGVRLERLVDTGCQQAPVTGPSGPTGPASPPEQEKDKKHELPGKGKGKGQKKHNQQNGTTGDQQGGGVEITPTGPSDGGGLSPGGTTP